MGGFGMGGSKIQLSRRAFLRTTAVGAGAASLGAMSNVFAQRKVDVHCRLFSAPSTAQLRPGNATNVLRYTGGLIYGPKDAVVPLPNSHLGPTFRFRRGQRVAVDYRNQLAEASVVHFHGLHVPDPMDGHPYYSVEAGDAYRYEFNVINRHGTYWYHAHPDMTTGSQVYRGLAGFVIVSDGEEDRVPLPRGKCDIPLVIQDRTLNSSNQFQFAIGSQAGVLGNSIMTNGVLNYALNVSTRHYRLRILNGSNSRIYKLGWSDSRPLVAIGTDGGLLEAPIEMPYIMLAPGQRVELWLDCTDDQIGSSFKLQSLAFSGGGPGSGSPPQGSAMDLFTVNVTQSEPEPLTMPSHLTTIPLYNPQDASNYQNSRVFGLEHMGMWSINGRTYQGRLVADDEKVRLNNLEIWEFRNDLAATFIQPHPMHLHGPQFQILSRVQTNTDPNYNTVRDGFVDQGWHDTVLVWPGERIEILVKFTHYTGIFLYHCHNLEHEDMGMMRSYEVLP
jgi:FtsP/CotA-like multicopper oxidase with cupredoxin domain